ncbi:unnamed protein product [Rhizophagus irregularis]|nr:unnamed protein product [Rhizophagus irregularis]CAB4388436.1 unnamed protein product [Rhizophagus irregularis]
MYLSIENFEILLIFDFRHSLGCAIHPLLFVPPILYLVVLANVTIMNLWLESWENSILNSVLYGRKHQELAYVKVLRSALKCQLENNAPIHLYTARDYVLVPDEQQRSRPGSL